MSAEIVVAGVVGILLLFYLVVSIVRPDKF
jgi:K+-transporting ATPase KdpF subunit